MPPSRTGRRVAFATMVVSTSGGSSGEWPPAAPSASQFLDALLQLLEQPGVLDGDDGLVRERLQQRDLPLGERPHAPTE